MPSYDVFNIPKRFSFLFYGKNGAGKSHLGGTVIEVDELLPAYFIDADYGSITCQKIAEQALKSGRTVEFIQKNLRFFQFDRAKPMSAQFKDIYREMEVYKPKFTLLDTASEFMTNYMEEISGHQVPQQAHWQALFTKTREFVTELQKRSFHYCSVTHPGFKTVKNKKGEEIVIDIYPLVHGNKFPTFFNNLHNTVAMLESIPVTTGGKVKMKYQLSAVQLGVETARDRFGFIGVIENPTMKKIYDKMKGGIVISQAPGSEVEADMSRVVQPQEFNDKEESTNGDIGTTVDENLGLPGSPIGANGNGNGDK